MACFLLCTVRQIDFYVYGIHVFHLICWLGFCGMDLVCAASGQPDCLGDAVADRTATKRSRILTHFTFLGFLQAVRVTMQRLGLAMVAARIVSPNGRHHAAVAL
ncbi:hypothetical protein D8B24_05200 [Verminephrobacter aporrectodeae subsp. tuberculatae]|nr:hypothetical protein [Verminephrobacter aporrectodeae subsp. tuberculatae]